MRRYNALYKTKMKIDIFIISIYNYYANNKSSNINTIINTL